jgi:hypothetical protein
MTHLQAIIKLPCVCVRCHDCFGSGQAHVDRTARIAVSISEAADLEGCNSCHESGFIKTCARCLAIDHVLKNEGQILEAA